MSSSGQSFKSLVSELIGEINQLIRQELRLAQAEMSEKVDQAQSGAISLLVGLMMGVVALIVLAQALVIALSNSVPAWAAAVIVGLGFGIVGFAMVKAGQSNLRPANLTPERTIRSVRRGEEVAMEKSR